MHTHVRVYVRTLPCVCVCGRLEFPDKGGDGVAISADARSLLSRMLAKDPAQRITVQEIKVTACSSPSPVTRCCW